ncbi:MAG: 2'-5' RNA ligase family protein [Anaerolineae bacterium]|nr:2'-5' RNA ligase family protein [Anaerolineae bacterium]
MTESAASQGPRYAFVIRLPREHEVMVENAYLSLAGVTKPVINYHVTLVGPFRLRHEPLEAVERIIADACRRWKPFDVRVHGVRAFETSRDNIAYLDVVTPERVVALRGFLLKQLLPLILPENEHVGQFTLAHYHPHVTLGLGLSDTQLLGILAAAEKCSVDLLFRVDCVWLISQARPSPWRCICSFVLGKDAHSPYTPRTW